MEGLQTVGSALLSLGLVAVAFALSLYQRLDLEREISVAVVRSFVQLAAIGYVINFIFGLESIGAIALLLAGMASSPPGPRRAGPGMSRELSGWLRSPWGWRR